MHYVYLLRSLNNTSRTYIGLTDDLKARLKNHHEGGTATTSKYHPWELVGYVALADRRRVGELERYLKRGSGHAFARRHLWPHHPALRRTDKLAANSPLR